MNAIRNFAIIAHVDHGKSTLADRLLELTGTIDKDKHDEQMLDRNPISRERGITIKLAPVRMKHKEYMLHLIDTPGHVDFSYEVDRTLACVEGAVLLVDATQGIQAQTIANTYKAIEKNLTIIPVVNKIDMPNAEVNRVTTELKDFLGINADDIIPISAKTGENVERVLEAIIEKVPPPQLSQHVGRATPPYQGGEFPENKALLLTKEESPKGEVVVHPLQALIFDSYFDPHKGVIAFVRLFSGSAHAGDVMKLAIGDRVFESTEVGIFTPDLVTKDSIEDGEIGYIVTNLKDIHDVRVGDTIVGKKDTEGLPGYKKVKPMVYASLFPTETKDYENVKKAIEKIYLTDSALEFKPIYSQALGPGFRVGFLGLLHADVIRERLEREYFLSLVLTPPQVDYEMDGSMYKEPIVKILIITPQEYVGGVMQLCEEHRALFLHMDNKNQVTIEYEMPLSEMISDFFDQLKSITSGYASFDWELVRYEHVDADKLGLMLNGDEVEEFSQVVVSARSLEIAQRLTKKLRELIPRQQYEVKIQAKYKGKIIASERLSPFRKDVLTKGGKTVGGGDVGRKRKVLERQKEGKKKMKMIGHVEVPKDAFMKLFKE
ncbi:MAG: GTP-binding protein [bacterium]|nr:GTP-binding protein [bacterium]